MGQTNTKTSEDQARNFVIAFDAGDVHWLRGYCHLLMAVCDFWLAGEARSFNRTAHLIYPNPETPYEFLRHRSSTLDREMVTQIIDGIAIIHLIRLEVSKPERLKRAHDHLLAVIDQSQQSWKLVLAETDNDREHSTLALTMNIYNKVTGQASRTRSRPYRLPL